MISPASRDVDTGCFSVDCSFDVGEESPGAVSLGSDTGALVGEGGYRRTMANEPEDLSDNTSTTIGHPPLDA